MKSLKVSIITPVYNSEDVLSEMIESVLNQKYKTFEHILIDDSSTDRSAEIINKYASQDKRIKYVKLKENSGAAVARNTGLEIANGNYIAFLDCDDKWHSEKLKTQLRFMEDTEKAFTYTNYERITKKGEVFQIPKLPSKLDYFGLLKNTAIATSTVIINRDIIGDFRMPLVRKGQDTATWLQILKNHEYAYLVDEILSQYRSMESSLSSNKLGALKRTWNTYRNIEKLPFYKASYYFVFYMWNATIRRI